MLSRQPDTSAFDVESFVSEQVSAIRQILGNEKAMIACSGGVDSTTCAALTYKAVGKNLVCIFIDTGFMRLKEPESVIQSISNPPLSLPIELVKARDIFMQALRGLKDAEDKRKAFREAFYQVLADKARTEKCKFLVQGTISADVIETKGGIKTQHNVLEQIGIRSDEKYGFTLVEPLASLFKDQVRLVAKYLGVPPEISERQPFPGPGLTVRCVEEILPNKLKTLKLATQIVEKHLEVLKAEQYFAAVMDSHFESRGEAEGMKKTVANSLKIAEKQVRLSFLKSKATGIAKDLRVYGKIAALDVMGEERETCGKLVDKLAYLAIELTQKHPELTRVLYLVKESKTRARNLVAIRAIKTKDFMTAEIAPAPWITLLNIANEVLKKCPTVSAVYYDITPKPPGTIEFE